MDDNRVCQTRAFPPPWKRRLERFDTIFVESRRLLKEVETLLSMQLFHGIQLSRVETI